MKLITEHTEDVQYLEEKVGDKKNLFIENVRSNYHYSNFLTGYQFVL